MTLPGHLDWPAFDALHDDIAAWWPAVEVLAAVHGARAIEPRTDGTVLVACTDTGQVIKLYPPFLRDHFDVECAMLDRLHGRLRVPTPRLIATGERDGWPYLLMSRLDGEPLTGQWPSMPESQRCALLAELGALTTEVHALPVGDIASLAPRWADFVAGQRTGCLARQQRNGLSAHLLAALPSFIAGPLPTGPDVLLTGEYTPMNLFAAGGRLIGMFDFGDGLVGPREYDWLGPLCFLAAGDPTRCRAFLDACGATLDDALRHALLRLLLLHRYSHPPAQIAFQGWQDARDFEEVAARIWP